MGRRRELGTNSAFFLSKAKRPRLPRLATGAWSSTGIDLPVLKELGPKKRNEDMMKIVSVKDENGKCVQDENGKIVKRHDHYQIRKVYHSDGDFVSSDGRRYSMVWKFKYSR